MRIRLTGFKPNRATISLVFLSMSLVAFPKNGNDTLLVQIIIREAETFQNTLPDKTDSLALVALQLSNTLNYQEGIAQSNFILATNRRIANHNIQAINFYRNSLSYYKKSNNKPKIQEICEWLGLCLAQEAYYDSGRVYIDYSIKLADTLKHPEAAAQANLNMARLYKSKGLFHLSLLYCRQALAKCDSVQDDNLFWKIKNFTGFVYLQINMHKEAMEIFNETLPDINDHLDEPEEVYRLLYYTSQLYFFLKDYPRSKQNQLQAIKIADKIPNRQLSTYFKGLSQRSIGEVYNKLNVFDSAHYYLSLALTNKELMLDLHAAGQIYYCIGDLFYKEGNTDSALFYFTKSAKIHIANKEIDRLLWSNMGIGKTYFKSGNLNLARKYLLSAIDIESENQNPEVLAETTGLLGQLYEKTGDYKKAYEYFKIFKKTSDELFNDDKIRKITQLEIENEYRDKQKQLEHEQLQEKMKLELRIKQNRLTTSIIAGGLFTAILVSLLLFRSFRIKKKSNQEKEILLKEIHHRVKNNLQIISSMLNLQGSYLSDQKIKDAVNESQGRVKSMALIHQMLYQHEKFSAIDIGEYIRQLSETIASNYSINKKNIELKLTIGHYFIDIDTAIPLGLIINELLTNSFKYAFPENRSGWISVSLDKLENDKFVLEFRDNGIGLPESAINSKQSKTLGLNMVNILTRQLKGDLQIKVSDGTSFSIRFTEIIKTQKKG